MAKLKHTEYDVAVIGGGPAGMMAAGRAAESGARVVLIEKNEKLGEKLLITGGGRCNVTNATFDNRALLEKFKTRGKFLFSTFAQHSVQDTLDFFNSRGMATRVENENRVFPATQMAKSVWDVLVQYMKKNGVDVVTGLSAKGFHIRDGKIVGLNTDRETIVAGSYILATGGTSHPETGSTGEGFEWLKKAGHTINEPSAALVPVKIKERWVHELSGVSHQHVKLSVIQNGKKVESKIGRMVFTHFGMSGPLVLNMSRDIGIWLDNGPIELSIDLLPDVLPDLVDSAVLEMFGKNLNKKIKNCLKEIIPPAFVETIITLSGLDKEKEVNLISREERKELTRVLKDMRMTPTGFVDQKEAIVASGGVELKEIDFKTMQSLLIPNQYLIGDVLDIERPSGGYSLQLCWTTGWVAGTHAGGAKKKK
jgi:predicted Rossmann fold flavoprotein